MQKLKLLLCVLLVIILSVNIVLALSPLPPVKCSLSGTIKNVEFKEAGQWGTPGQIVGWPDEYRLEIKIEQVSKIDDDFTEESCEQAYPLNSLQTISIPKEKVSEGDVFTVNSKVSGLTSRGFGTQFTSYNIESIEKTQETTNNNLLILGGVVVLIIIVLFLVFKLIKKKK